jgi:hypothetical protein
MKLFVICLIPCLLFIASAFAWENKVTHPDLSRIAAEKYYGDEASYLKEKVNGQELRC